MKVWFITGASRGFGRIWAEAALGRGDAVVATARNPDDLMGLAPQADPDRLKILRLDVTDRAGVFAAFAEAVAQFGRIDVVISNAGYGHVGMVEEITEDEARAQMESNFFGTLSVLQAALPHLRARRSGHLIAVSSIGGITALPALSLYCASKWAVEALCESLAAEVRDFGIHVTLLEPAGYATSFAGSSSRHSSPLPAYADAHAQRADRHGRIVWADPQPTAGAVLELVDMAKPPLRLLLGKTAHDRVRQAHAAREADWERYRDLTAQG